MGFLSGYSSWLLNFMNSILINLFYVCIQKRSQKTYITICSLRKLFVLLDRLLNLDNFQQIQILHYSSLNIFNIH